MCGYFCTGFIDFILKGKSLLDFTNLFSPNEYEKKDKIILNGIKVWFFFGNKHRKKSLVSS